MRILQALLLCTIALSSAASAESTFRYDFLYATFGINNFNSPLSGKDKTGTNNTLGFQKEIGAQFIISSAIGYQAFNEYYNDVSNERIFKINNDAKSLGVSVERYFSIKPTLDLVTSVQFTRAKLNTSTKLIDEGNSLYLSASQSYTTNSSSAAIKLQYKLSETSPYEFTTTAIHGIDGDNDSLILLASAGMFISNNIFARFSYSQSLEQEGSNYTYGMQYHF